MSRDKVKILYVYFLKTHNHQPWKSGDIGWGAFTYQARCPFDHLVTWKKTLYLHFHNTYKHETWHNGDLGQGAWFYWVICTFDLVVIWCNLTK